MKNTPLGLWLSAANGTAGWWMGHAANVVRAQQRAMAAEMARAATGAKPKRRRKARAKRRSTRV